MLKFWFQKSVSFVLFENGKKIDVYKGEYTSFFWKTLLFSKYMQVVYKYLQVLDKYLQLSLTISTQRFENSCK